MTARPITQAEITAWRSAERWETQLPKRTAGGFTLTELSISCAFCNQPTAPQHCRGHVLESEGHVILTGMTYCADCDRYTLSAHRVRDHELGVVMDRMEDGQWKGNAFCPVEPWPRLKFIVRYWWHRFFG